jgi:exodeoxyribonuclease-3
MRIATWNVNSLRARVDFVLLWLQERRPDVVALQELKMEESELPEERFAELGYEVAALGQKSWNGVALLSRAPLEVTQRGLPGHDAMGARLLTAKTSGLSFTSVYVPNGKTLEHEDFGKKLAWLDGLCAHLEEHHDPSAPMVVGGDFNICPGALDSWRGAGGDGNIFCTEEERKRFSRLLEWGLVDVWRAQNPDSSAFSWWDYRGGAFHKKQGLRIDFLLASPSVAARVGEVTLDRDWRKKHEGLTASDHAPVFADLSD